MRDDEGTRTSHGSDPAPAAPESIPASIGRYRVLAKLGEGGMGVVYEAEQPEPRRHVALKVIRGGAFVDETRVRLFQREAETLARLEHPDIGAIYESGRTDDGQHFFAMELVRGRTLDRFLADRPAPDTRDEVRFRLRLMRRIVDAVHYAHQRGVIHRDLKPSNIVVADEDGAATGSTDRSRPGIKILDFGLARITDADVAAATVVSEIGAIKGTLPYMSPEQARGNPADIDTRTDVYALGVILYQMLAGRLPYDTSRGSLIESIRVICEESPGALGSIGGRRVDPDLQTIVRKALEKEADRRYGSAAALSEDLERYLGDQPILARPPSTFYQLRKFTRRHRALVGGAALGVLALALGLVGTTWGLARARTEAHRSNQVSNLMREMLEGISPAVAQGEDTALLHRILKEASARIDEELAGQPSVAASMRWTLATAYNNIGEFDQAEAELQAALRDLSGADEDAPDVLRVQWQLGIVQRNQGRIQEALETAERAATALRRRLGPRDPQTLRAVKDLGTTQYYASRYEDAERTLREVVEAAEADDAFDAVESGARAGLGLTLLRRGANEEAETVLAGNLERCREHFGDTHPDTLIAVANLAGLYKETGRTDRAEALQEEAVGTFTEIYGADHPNTLIAKTTLASLYRETAQLDRAEALFDEILRVAREARGPEHPTALGALRGLSRVRSLQRRYDEAERLDRELLEIYRRRTGENSEDTLGTISNLTTDLRAQGRNDEALALQTELVERARATFGDRHPTSLLYLTELAHAYAALERFDEAETAYRESLDGRAAVLGEGHPDTLISLNSLGVLHMRRKQFAEAMPLLERALDKQRLRPGADHPNTLITQYNLGRTLYELDELDRAEATYADLVERALRVHGPDHGRTVIFRTGVAMTYGKQRRWAEAAALYAELADAVRRFDPPDPRRLADLEERLAEARRAAGA